MGEREVMPLTADMAREAMALGGRILALRGDTMAPAVVLDVVGDSDPRIDVMFEDGFEDYWYLTKEEGTHYLAAFVDHEDERRAVKHAAGPVLPQDDATRKASPLYRGNLAYFPAAHAAIAAHSLKSDRKHNPNTPEAEAPHWSMDKSSDHLDCVGRHLSEIVEHSDPDLVLGGAAIDEEEYQRTALAWRAMAQLQVFLMRRYGYAPGGHAR